MSKNWFYFILLIFWHAPILPSCWLPCYRHWFFTYIFFKCFAFFQFITPRQKSDINNSFRIMFIKINIIKVDFIKVYAKNTHFITKKCGYSSLWNKGLWSFLIIVSVTNQSATNFNDGRQSSTDSSHIFWALCLSG